MSDIVEWLRQPADPDDPNLWEIDRRRREAADVIERLRALIHPFEGAMAKVEEQGNEIERLRIEAESWKQTAKCFQAEGGGLLAEIERLKAALRLAADEYRLGYSEETMMAIRSALEGK